MINNLNLQHYIISALCYFFLITPSIILLPMGKIPRITLGWCFSNYDVHITHLGILLKTRIWFGIQVGSEILHNKLLDDADAAGPQITGHTLNSEVGDKLLGRGKMLFSLLSPLSCSPPTPHPRPQYQQIAQLVFVSSSGNRQTLCIVIALGHSNILLDVTSVQLHIKSWQFSLLNIAYMFSPLLLYYTPVFWLVFLLFQPLFHLINSLHFCQNDNPETGFSLPPRQTLSSLPL